MDSCPDPAEFISRWLKVDKRLASKLAVWLEALTEEELRTLVRT
jgi:hypothetical protein